MQTIFRLPWSTEPSSDEALADKMYIHKRQKPRVEIPLLNNIKRKRNDSLDVSPKNALHVKKLKGDLDGAVQPALVPAKGVEAIADIRAPKSMANGNMPPLRWDHAPATPASIAQAVGNASKQTVKEREMSAPAITPVSTQTASPAPTPMAVDAAPVVSETIAAAPAPVLADPQSNLDKLRAIIDAQINLEILHKHNELRLIEQELAKCQISLEQLRRCELIAYPGTSGPSQAVTQGTGKAIKPSAGYTEPQFPAPWGVTDGPYARHYAKWLLNDPAFDSYSSSHVGTPMTTRNSRVRGSAFDFSLPAVPVRTSRTSTGNRQEPGTPTGRDPMIMKRQADGEWVRLRCSTCHRSNFNNIQGFLNHCRIAHHQDYKSHEAAAIACGEIVQVDEATMTASEAAPTPKEPLPRTVSMPITLPAPSLRVETLPVTTPVEQPHVNPLILHNAIHKPLDRVVDLSSTSTPSPKPAVARSSMKNSFKGSLTPHLSALMQRRGLSTSEIPSFITEAKKKVDLSVYDDTDSEHDTDGKLKKHKQKKPKTTQRSHSTPGGAFARPPSAKGTGRQMPTFAVCPPPASGVGFSPSVFQIIPDTPSVDDVEMDLSPGTAPGLVSDHEDDFDDCDEARSANGSLRDVHMEDVEIRDASDVEREERKRVNSRIMGDDSERVCRQATTAGAAMC